MGEMCGMGQQKMPRYQLTRRLQKVRGGSCQKTIDKKHSMGKPVIERGDVIYRLEKLYILTPIGKVKKKYKLQILKIHLQLEKNGYKMALGGCKWL